MAIIPAPAPSILDIFVVWHPDDVEGSSICDELVEHYHSPAFSGLAGGAVDVYARSDPWDEAGAPRPIPWNNGAPATPRDAMAAALTVVLPVVGPHLVASAADPTGPWHRYLEAICSMRAAEEQARDGSTTTPVSAAVIPVILSDDVRYDNAPLVATLMRREGIHRASSGPERSASDTGRLPRDLGQMVVQRLLTPPPGPSRLTVFVSHARDDATRTTGVSERGARPDNLVTRVRDRLQDTRLDAFFDLHDLQPGEDWITTLEQKAASSALLMVRTDHYSSREWTQWEVLDAKRADMPIVCITALVDGEERGSFLLDHVPTVAYPVTTCEPPAWSRSSAGTPHPGSTENGRDEAVVTALNRLVDECFKRALWRRQEVFKASVRESVEHHPSGSTTGGETAQGDRLGFDNDPVHAPEPATLARFLHQHKKRHGNDQQFWVIHPDPPLLPPEHDVIVELCQLAGYERDKVHVLTPRTFLASGGLVGADEPELSTGDIHTTRPLTGQCLGLSMALGEDLGRLGLRNRHLERVIAEISQLVLLAGGSVTYAGTLGTHVPDLTKAVVDTVLRYTEQASREEHKRRRRDEPAHAIHAGPMVRITAPRIRLTDEDALSRLRAAATRYASTMVVEVIDERGEVIPLHQVATWSPHRDAATEGAVWQRVRQRLPHLCDARLVIGGKTVPASRDQPDGYSGSIPGIIEEALYTVRSGQPLYIAAGFGGAAALLAHELGLPGAPAPLEGARAAALTAEVRDALEEIRRLYNTPDRQALTGLDHADLTRLTATHRPAELAGLVVKAMSARLGTQCAPAAGAHGVPR